METFYGMKQWFHDVLDETAKCKKVPLCTRKKGNKTIQASAHLCEKKDRKGKSERGGPATSRSPGNRSGQQDWHVCVAWCKILQFRATLVCPLITINKPLKSARMRENKPQMKQNRNPSTCFLKWVSWPHRGWGKEGPTRLTSEQSFNYTLG